MGVRNKKGRRRTTALSLECLKLRFGGLWARHVLGLQALGTALDLEFYFRSFFQRAVTRHLDSREVYEHIIAVGALDETIALGGVKPFHDTFFSHYLFS